MIYKQQTFNINIFEANTNSKTLQLNKQLPTTIGRVNFLIKKYIRASSNLSQNTHILP